MKKHGLVSVFLLITSIFFGQTPCDDANSDLIYAYSHVKSAYKSNNISHLKYYANRSLESFERSKPRLTKCGCDKAYNLAVDCTDLLKKVETAETFEDGRFFVKRAKELAQQSVTELDRCTIPANEVQALTSLQSEQAKLKEQQEALKRKAEEIKTKLAEQEKTSVNLQKEALINSYEEVILSNVESYNNALKVCECDYRPLTQENTTVEISKKSLEEIKLFYLDSLKGLTANYLSQLNKCTVSKI